MLIRALPLTLKKPSQTRVYFNHTKGVNKLINAFLI